MVLIRCTTEPPASFIHFPSFLSYSWSIFFLFAEYICIYFPTCFRISLIYYINMLYVIWWVNKHRYFLFLFYNPFLFLPIDFQEVLNRITQKLLTLNMFAITLIFWLLIRKEIYSVLISNKFYVMEFIHKIVDTHDQCSVAYVRIFSCYRE